MLVYTRVDSPVHIALGSKYRDEEDRENCAFTFRRVMDYTDPVRFYTLKSISTPTTSRICS